jgi:hypothetical protein
MAGLGSLIQGFQSGYDWVDNNQRQAADDKFKGEQRDRLRKDWSKEDEYESARKALVAKHFGTEADKPAPAEDANPSRVLAMQQGADPQAGAVAAPDVAVTPVTTPPTIVAPAAPAAAQAVAGAGRGFVNPPGPVGAGRGNINPPVASPSVQPQTATTGGWPAINASYIAGQPARNADRGAILNQELAQATNPETRALLQREIAGDGKFQFIAANNGANVAQPTAPAQPAVKLAADGVETPVQTRPTKVDPSQDMNKTLNFALESAKLDVQYGKKDGAGLITLARTVESMKREGMDQAIKLLGQGRYQEAQDLFNSQGDHTGVTVVSSKDSTFNIGKTAVPTKIVTLRKEDGTTRTINTAEAQYQMIDMAKQIDQAQAGQKVENDRVQGENTASHYRAVEGNQAATLGLQREEFNAKTPEGVIAAKEKALGRPLTIDERQEVTGISKLPEVVKTRVASLQEQQKTITQVIAKAQADGTWQPGSEGAKALAEQQAQIALSLRTITEPYLEGTRSKANADPLGIRSVKPGDSAQAGAPKAEAKPSAGAALAAKGTTTAADKDMKDAKAWIKDKLIGTFDGPGKYAEIAKSHPDAKIRAAAAALDAEYKANIAANTN